MGALLYPCGGVGAGQARGAVPGGEGAVGAHAGQAHERVGDHSDVIGRHEWNVVRRAPRPEGVVQAGRHVDGVVQGLALVPLL